MTPSEVRLPPEDAENLRRLAVVYLRHADAPRALALAIVALRYGQASPGLVLLVADCFLKVAEPEQALAALSRFEQPAEMLSRAPEAAEIAACRSMTARALHRLNETDAARSLLVAEP